MITIGIMDDKKERKDSFKDAIELYLKKSKREGVEVIDCEPLEHKEDYITWINQNDIAALIIDEKLAEVPLEATGKSCGYEGHDMAETLRTYESTIPIHVVTSAKNYDELEENRELFENVLPRADFLKDRDTWTEIFIRSGQQYYKEREKLFLRIAELSKLIVNKTATEENINELMALQQFFQIPLYNEEMMKREDLISEFRSDLENLERLNNEAKAFLKNNNDLDELATNR